ncbi:hypothetical protein GE09DRAFT_62091 [Coniochaeta sp. 2T2.1]|nr:hypothetical protein GE09DRAFT_62091 [Coniochaeta sp. 2T2.1]
MPFQRIDPSTSVTIIYSPYHVGVRDEGPGAGPSFLRSHGFVQSLQSVGLLVHEVDIEPVDDFEGEIGRSFEILRRTSKLVTEARDRSSFPVVLSGNCSATVGVAAGLSGSKTLNGADIGCIWFDAHDDYNTPDTVMSGYFDSMGIAMLTDECWKGLLATVPGHRAVDLQNVVHVGMRDVTEAERKRVIDSGLDVVWGSDDTDEQDVYFAEQLGQVLTSKELGHTMVHVDLDCLDKSLGHVNKFAAAGGLYEQDLIECLATIMSLSDPTSLTVASFDPSYEGAENIARIATQAVTGFFQGLASKGAVLLQPKNEST